MHQISGNELSLFFKHYWKWFAVALALLLGLLMAPQGTLQPRTSGEGDTVRGLGAIIPSGVFEPTEDGRAYGYSDRCVDNITCRQCKSNLTCLQCMNNCYNRHGAFYDGENPQMELAMNCNTRCISEARAASIDVNKDTGFAEIAREKQKQK